MGDTGGCGSKNDILDLLIQTYPSDPENRLTNYASQLCAFLDTISVGDLIILPSKTRRGYVWFGRASGNYEYDAKNAEPERRKFIPVTWATEPISRSSIGADLLNSLNASQTVFSPSRNNAANRLERIAATGIDPKAENLHVVARQSPQVDQKLEDDEAITDPLPLPTMDSIVDQIRSHITKNFKEHDLTWLVADILTAHGFECEVSPPGPDGGVDIKGRNGTIRHGFPDSSC